MLIGTKDDAARIRRPYGRPVQAGGRQASERLAGEIHHPDVLVHPVADVERNQPPVGRQAHGHITPRRRHERVLAALPIDPD